MGQIILVILFFLTSCISPLEKGQINLKLDTVQNNKKPIVDNVVLENDQLKISGNYFKNLKSVKINSQILSVVSNSENQIVLSASTQVMLALNSVLNLVVETAYGAASVSVTFNLVDSSVTASKIADGSIDLNHLSTTMVGISAGKVLQFNGLSWELKTLDGLVYKGAYDASNLSDQTSIAPVSGHYYIVQTSGSVDPDGVDNGISYSVNDWSVFNGTSWDRIIGSNSVTSVNGQTGVVNLSWSDIPKTGSSINDLSDVDTTGIAANKILKFDGTKWIISDDLSSGGASSVSSTEILDNTISDSDINSSAAIAQSKIANLTADLSNINSDITTNTSDIANLSTSIATTNSNVSTNATNITTNTTSISNLSSSKVDKTTTVNGLSLNANVVLDTDDIAEGVLNLYHTTARARAASVVDSTTGSETDQAPSVSAMKNYVLAQTGAVTSSQWTTNSSDIYFNTGNVGIGNTTPNAKLDVDGALILADDSSACSSTNKGAIQFNSTTNLFEYCNGVLWLSRNEGESVPANTVMLMKSCPVGWGNLGTTGGGPSSATCDAGTCFQCQSPAARSLIPSGAIVLLESCPKNFNSLGTATGPGAASHRNINHASCVATSDTALAIGTRFFSVSCPIGWRDLGVSDTGPGNVSCGASCRVCEVPGSDNGQPLLIGENGGTISHGQNISIKSGEGGTTSGISGNINLNVGNSYEGAGGLISLNAGNAATTATSSFNGGSINLISGNGVGATGLPGDIKLDTGYNSTTSIAGNIILAITAGSKVGIGNSTPSEKLDVTGNIKATSFYGDGSNLTGITTSGSSNTADVILNADSDTNASGGILFQTAGNTRMSIANDGAIGIGNTSPTSKLSIGDNLGTGYALTANSQTSYGQIIQTSEATPSSNAALWVRTTDDGGSTSNTLFRVQNNGNIGINQVAPTSMLHITEKDDTWNSSFRMDRSWDSTTDFMQMMFDYEGLKFRTMADGLNEANIIFKPLNVETMRITDTGRVGIGTSSPQFKLDVKTNAFIGTGTTTYTGTAPLVLKAPAGHDQLLFDDGTIQTIMGARGNVFRIEKCSNTDCTSRSPYLNFNMTFPQYFQLLNTPNFRLSASADLGSAGMTITSAYGNGVIGMESHSMKRDLTVKAANRTGTDLDGGTLYLEAGASTGTGGSSVEIKTASPSSTGSSANAPTTKMIITGAGNVGIGVTPSASTLEVEGNNATFTRSSTFGNVASFRKKFTATNNEDPYIEFRHQTISGGDFDRYGYIQGGVGHDGLLIQGQNASSYSNVLINQLGGNVGIGTMSPTAKLDVVSAATRGYITQESSDVGVLGIKNSTADSVGVVRISNDVRSWDLVVEGRAGQNDYFGINDLGGGGRRFTIDLNGRVGIGTAAPATNLHVTNGTAYGAIMLGLDGGTSNNAITHEADGSFNIWNGTFGSGTNLLKMDSSGNLGLGKTASYKLDVNGLVAGSGAYVNSSDIRFKENVELIDDSLSKLMRLEGVSFRWKNDEFPEKNFKQGSDIGLIAQNVQDVFPEAVEVDKDGYLSVAYAKIVAPLVEAVKELVRKLNDNNLMDSKTQKDVQENKREIASLKEENEKLKSQNEQMKQALCEINQNLSFCSKKD